VHDRSFSAGAGCQLRPCLAPVATVAAGARLVPADVNTIEKAVYQALDLMALLGRGSWQYLSSFAFMCAIRLLVLCWYHCNKVLGKLPHK